MKNQKLIFAAVIGVVFCFAGYNLWSYFKEQQAIQMEEDRLASERKIAREQERKDRLAADAAAQQEAEAKKEADRLERKRAAEAKRLADEQAADERRIEIETAKAEKAAARLAERIREARTLKRAEDIPADVIQQLNSVSNRYIRDKPEEFLDQRFDKNTFGARTSFERLVQANTNTFMLFAAVGRDTDVLQALLDIGMDVNAANDTGYTPLMFAAAYNTPEIVQFLVRQGGDINAQAYLQDLTPLHIAALFNPNPNVIDTLLDLGANIEAQTENEQTALLLAASDNPNLEVAERLAKLGADRTVYSLDGLTVQGLVQQRVAGQGDRYVSISDEVDQRIIGALAE